MTQNTLLYRGGSELFLVDVARALQRRGHEPVIFTAVLGEVANDFREAGILVVDELTELQFVPDLIHGQHHLEALQALLHFPNTPAIHVCHGLLPWQEAPLQFPRIVRHVAMSELIREHLVTVYRIPRERVELFLNFADLTRFQTRPPLPPRPRRALIFSNQASEATYVPAVRAACKQIGVHVDVIGIANGNRTTTPEAVLPAYDVVFARGRAAIEALAVGAAVVLCDVEGSGPLVTTGNVDRLRSLNFAIGAFTGPCTAEALLEQLRRYDAVDAAQVSLRIRGQAGLEPAVDRLLAIYADALEEFRSAPAPTIWDERQAIIRHARWLSSVMLQQGNTRERSDALQLTQRIATERHAIERERETYARDRDAFVRTLEAYRREREAYLGERGQ